MTGKFADIKDYLDDKQGSVSNGIISIGLSALLTFSPFQASIQVLNNSNKNKGSSRSPKIQRAVSNFDLGLTDSSEPVLADDFPEKRVVETSNEQGTSQQQQAGVEINIDDSNRYKGNPLSYQKIENRLDEYHKVNDFLKTLDDPIVDVDKVSEKYYEKLGRMLEDLNKDIFEDMVMGSMPRPRSVGKTLVEQGGDIVKGVVETGFNMVDQAKMSLNNLRTEENRKIFREELGFELGYKPLEGINLLFLLLKKN